MSKKFLGSLLYDFDDVSTSSIGNLSDLTTTSKTNVVSAINEVNGKFPVAIIDGGTGGTTAAEARTNLGLAGVLVGTELYANYEGGYGSIELSDNYTNYNYLYVQYHDNYRTFGSVVLNRWHGDQVCASMSYLISDGGALVVKTALLSFATNTVTWSRSGTMTIPLTGSNMWNATNEAIKVTQVVGYKSLNE